MADDDDLIGVLRRRLAMGEITPDAFDQAVARLGTGLMPTAEATPAGAPLTAPDRTEIAPAMASPAPSGTPTSAVFPGTVSAGAPRAHSSMPYQPLTPATAVPPTSQAAAHPAAFGAGASVGVSVATMPPPTGGYFLRHWRGELSGVKTYWINVALAWALYAGLLRILDIVADRFPATLDLASPAVLAFLCIIAACLALGIAMSIWQMVGLWRWARANQANGGSGLHTFLARLTVICIPFSYLHLTWYIWMEMFGSSGP